jgi:hypothetical protein
MYTQSSGLFLDEFCLLTAYPLKFPQNYKWNLHAACFVANFVLKLFTQFLRNYLCAGCIQFFSHLTKYWYAWECCFPLIEKICSVCNLSVFAGQCMHMTVHFDLMTYCILQLSICMYVFIVFYIYIFLSYTLFSLYKIYRTNYRYVYRWHAYVLYVYSRSFCQNPAGVSSSSFSLHIRNGPIPDPTCDVGFFLMSTSRLLCQCQWKDANCIGAIPVGQNRPNRPVQYTSS